MYMNCILCCIELRIWANFPDKKNLSNIVAKLYCIVYCIVLHFITLYCIVLHFSISLHEYIWLPVYCLYWNSSTCWVCGRSLQKHNKRYFFFIFIFSKECQCFIICMLAAFRRLLISATTIFTRVINLI